MARLIGMLVPLALIGLFGWLSSFVRAQVQLSQMSPLPREVRSLPDNPTTPEKVELGRLLF